MIEGIFDKTLWLFLEMVPYLLLGLIFVGILHLIISKQFIARHIGNNKFSAVVKAALFGVPLPLCSCGVLPTSVYMAKNGASKPATLSFLISTPQTGVDSILATYGMMGWIFAIFRPIAAFIMGVAGGATMNILSRKDRFHEFKETENADDCGCEDDCDDNCSADICDDEECNDNCSDDNTINKNKSFREKLRIFFEYSFVEFLDDISMPFLVGVIISGLIAYFIPDNYFSDLAFTSGILGMLIIIAVGIPMYICATASIPIALTLMMKGFSPGIAFVFLAVGPATNAASLSVIGKALGKKFTILYLLMITILSIIFGYLLDYIFSIFNINMNAYLSKHHHEEFFLTDEIKIILGVIFFVLMLMSFYRQYIRKHFIKKEINMSKNKIYIEGMTCNHCKKSVEDAIKKVKGVSSVEVKLDEKAAYIEGDFNIYEIKKAIENSGYKVV